MTTLALIPNCADCKHSNMQAPCVREYACKPGAENKHYEPINPSVKDMEEHLPICYGKFVQGELATMARDCKSCTALERCLYATRQGIKSAPKELEKAEEARMDIIGQNGNDGLHYISCDKHVNLGKITSPAAQVNDGSSASYYTLPANAAELQDLISYLDCNAQLGEIGRAWYRYGRCAHSSKKRDLEKIIFYAKAELARLEKQE